MNITFTSQNHLKWIMKVSLIQSVFILLFINASFAFKTKGQELLNQKISLSLPSTEIINVLNSIEKKSNAKFVFSTKAIDAHKKVNAVFNEAKLKDVLDNLLKTNAINYKVIGSQIVLFSNLQENLVNSNIETPISGKVKDAKGNDMPGVSVILKNSTKGVSTDANGNFEINANPGDVIVFSFIGYKNQEITVGSSSSYQISMVESAGDLSEIVVIGSRGLPRTDVERPVPVDVLSAKELQTTGQTELGQQVQFMSPSFNSTKNGINGIANYADPASLKGLSPDQMLILINGKRYHQFAAVQTNVTVGKGTVVTDMNSIPSLALERMEILRDGAAAQYGSDAIAGIANMVLKKSVGKGTANIQYGVTSKGDGGGFTAGMNYGWALGKNGASLNLTGSYQDVTGTNRSDPYNPQPVTGIPGVPYAGIYTNVKATDEAALAAKGYWGNGSYGSFRVGKYGSNAMKSGQLFYNLDVPLKLNWTMYSFGGYSNKKVYAQAFLRTAVPASATSNPDLYPNGYVPDLPGLSVDYTSVIGLKKTVLNGWNLDFSTGYGKNYLDQWAINSSNASLGAASPKDFYAGRIAFGQSLSEANFSKAIANLSSVKSLNLAFGAQYRVDDFHLTPGDAQASPFNEGAGPLAISKGKTPGSQGRVGIDQNDATNIKRSNIGIYADIESDITKSLLLATAVRYENYSDFGSNFSGKIAGRLKLNESISIRGSINKGFRAPLLQQIANAASTSTVQSGVITSTKQLPSSDPRLAQVGIEAPKPETSWNYNLGITAKAGNNLLFTLDAYQIDIKDRIIITENLKVANIAALKALFPGYNEITFFTNQLSTQTKGVDLVASYKKSIGAKSRLSSSLALTVNQTKVAAVKATPDALQLGTKNPVVLVDTISRGLIETSQPHTKVLGSITYQTGKVAVTLRGTYFGQTTAWEKLSKPNTGTTNLNQAQTFSGKTVFDASVNYAISSEFALTIGANNFTNVYPDRVNKSFASYTYGQVPYSRTVNQFGFNGTYLYSSISYSF